MKELLKALAAAKKEITPITKDSTNPFYKSKYFDINQILESVEPILLKHGLLVIQPVKEGRVLSIIYHVESGESIESDIDLPNITDPQKLGMAITYYRRYTIQSLLSLQAQDDDGNTASKQVKKEESKLKTLTPKAFKELLTKDANTIKQYLDKEALKEKGFELNTDQIEKLNTRLAVLKASENNKDCDATEVDIY